MTLAAVTLDDKYELEQGRVYLTGTQALVRLPLMQRQRDLAHGHNTAGFISGYRGSPLGGFDRALWTARKYLSENDIHFQPGVNEDLGATAVWGSQQVNLWPGGRYDGVFGMWYGKGPGVDRTGDVFKHANFAGTSHLGGVLAITGDDHACKSSTVPHQSEHAFIASMIPVLHPANVQEIIDFGLIGFALSRYSGCWVAFKTIAETVDSSASVTIDPHAGEIVLPDDFDMPTGGLNIRWPDPPMVQEERLMRHKVYAALAFARANKVDRLVYDSDQRRFGIVTTGKSYLDVLQALEVLGVNRVLAAQLGICVYKVGMPWPLEPQGVRAFAEGLDELIVVEEKRALIENQLKEQLYNWQADKRPVIVGKFDERNRWILPSTGELSPAQIAVVIGKRLLNRIDHDGLAARVRFLEEKEAQKIVKHPNAIERVPYFCSGCPHNTSTNVPDGSRAIAGIGCHYMATWMDRNTDTFSQMGGEGVAWIGQAPFTETAHVFANLGDGTYFHSGLLAIRAAQAAKVNITYKILYNDAVAMTGGQPVDGQLSVPMIVDQVAAEGIEKIVVVTDEPDKYQGGLALPHHIPVEHRDDLDTAQKDLREYPGVSILIYDQTCAAEKRRRRKRKLMVDPPKRVFINEMVCEGCGDCSVKSNCLSVVPVETELGRKRAIDQSSCNKDYSCLNGFCPSFVTIEGGDLRKPKPAASSTSGQDWPALPDPALPDLNQPHGILVTGVGGTGVVTIGALLGMAAHLEGRGVSVLDQTGLAQKGGAVVSHVRIANGPDDINAVRIAAGAANTLLGCDLVVAASSDVLSKINPGVTRAVVNRAETITGDFTKNPDFAFFGDEMVSLIEQTLEGSATTIDATRIATALMGNSIAANLFMLGVAYQQGMIPVSGEAIDRAIELNGVSVEMNRQAFQWGRRAAVDPAAVEALVAKPREALPRGRILSESLEELIDRRERMLTDYQDAAYARRYRALVTRVWTAEAALLKPETTQPMPLGRLPLTEAVGRYAFKLMAIKDEYEVARLYTDGTFLKQVRQTFDGDYKIKFHLAPPLTADRDPETGHLKKKTYGPRMLNLFRLLARFKRLRGTALDVFGYSAERKAERRLRDDYLNGIERLVDGLNHDAHPIAVEIASIPEHIRGYGHVREAHIAAIKAQEQALWQAFENPPHPHREAAE